MYCSDKALYLWEVWVLTDVDNIIIWCCHLRCQINTFLPQSAGFSRVKSEFVSDCTILYCTVLYNILQESDEASVVSSDSDQDPGTDDSGVDSINSDPQLTVGSGGCEVGSMLSTLSERAETDCDLSWSEDSRGDSAAVRSFLHTSKQSELWSRAPTKTSVNHQMLMSPHHLLTPGEILRALSTPCKT